MEVCRISGENDVRACNRFSGHSSWRSFGVRHRIFLAGDGGNGGDGDDFDDGVIMMIMVMNALVDT